jgi:hypothetical protein
LIIDIAGTIQICFTTIYCEIARIDSRIYLTKNIKIDTSSF